MPRVTIELPGGRRLDGGHRVGDARLRDLSGHDEDWLSGRTDDVATAVLVTDLLARVVDRLGDSEPPSRDDIADLLVADRDYLLLRVWELSYSGRVWLVEHCPRCAAKMDVTFAVADVPVEVRPQHENRLELDLEDPNGQPVRVGVRLPSGRDQEALSSRPGDGVSFLLSRCVETVDGAPAGPDSLARLTPIVDRIDDALRSAAPVVELGIDLTCPECGHEFGLDCPIAPLVLDEIRSSGRHLLAEVHGLALHYHWSEHDILSLSRNRRRAYLTLLDRVLSPDEGAA